jgi:hypothetical protein
MSKTERRDLIRQRHQSRVGITRILDPNLPTLDELPQADVSDIVRTYQYTVGEEREL